MKTFLITVVGLFLGTLSADVTSTLKKNLGLEKKHYFYLKMADQWLAFPGIGLGYRYHQYHGFDVDFTAYTYYESNYALYGKAHYLYYPRHENFYVGLGAGVIGGSFTLDVGNNPFIYLQFGEGDFVKPTAEGLIGYEWRGDKNAIFLQFECGVTYGQVPVYPILSLGVGF